MSKDFLNLRFEIYPIDTIGYHLILPARINGKKVRLVIDTGASQSVFDKNRIAEITGQNKFRKLQTLTTGLGTSSMKSHLITLKSLQIGRLKLLNADVVLLDLSHVNKSYEFLNLPPIDGVIGSDFLLNFKAVIDYGKKIIRLHPQSKAKSASGKSANPA